MFFIDIDINITFYLRSGTHVRQVLHPFTANYV